MKHLFFLLFLIPQILFAQEDSARFARDTVRMNPVGEPELFSRGLLPEKKVGTPLLYSKNPNRLPEFSLKETPHLPYQTNPSLLFRGDYRTSGILKQFSNAALFASGGQTSVPGIGRFNEASLGYEQELNQKLALQLSMNALKINMAHFAGQSFSASGALIYQASDRVAFKVFGSYDIGNSYGMSTDRYGATMSLDMSDRFGMEMGVQRYYNEFRGQWETVPVAIPYYKFDKFKLGFDVGGLLYEILRNTVFDSKDEGGSTIELPRFLYPVK